MSIFKRRERAEESPPRVLTLDDLFDSETFTRKTAENVSAFLGGVSWIADRVASIPVKLYAEKDGKTVELRDDPRVRLLNDETPGDTISAREAKCAMTRDYLLRGRAYAHIERVRNRVVGIRYVKPDDVTWKQAVDPLNRSVTYYVGGREMPSYSMLRILRHTEDGVNGKSMIEESPLLLETGYEMLKFERSVTRSGGARKTVFQADKPLSKDAFEAYKEAVSRWYASNGQAFIVLNSGQTMKEMSATPTEMQAVENLESNAKQISSLTGVSEKILRSEASSEEAAQAISNAVLPILQAFESEMNRFLLLESEKATHYFAFDTKEVLRGDIEKRYRAYQTAINAHFMQINEVRYLEDLPPYETDFVALGLNDVLLDPKTGTIYTPNTDATVKITPSGVNGGDNSEN